MLWPKFILLNYFMSLYSSVIDFHSTLLHTVSSKPLHLTSFHSHWHFSHKALFSCNTSKECIYMYDWITLLQQWLAQHLNQLYFNKEWKKISKTSMLYISTYSYNFTLMNNRILCMFKCSLGFSAVTVHDFFPTFLLTK